MNSLVEADVFVESWNLCEQSFEFCAEQVLTFIRPLSNAQHITLDGSFIVDLTFVDLEDRLPVFHNLNCLELNYYRNFWDELMLAFLNCSPALETLIFPRGFIFVDPVRYVYNDPICLAKEQEFCSKALEVIPSCCRNHLKKIVIKYYFGTERELNLTQFLLRHALVLEELVVFRMKRAEADLENKLQSLPRASAACSIQVLNTSPNEVCGHV